MAVHTIDDFAKNLRVDAETKSRADQQRAPAAADPARRQWQRLAAGSRSVACRHARKPAGGAGSSQILLQATGVERQPLLRIPVQDCELLARLPESAIRDQVRHASAAPQWPSRGDLSSPRCRLRTGAPAKPASVVTINAGFAGVNQRWPGSIPQHQKSNLNQLRL
jgi:hypothetical protein